MHDRAQELFVRMIRDCGDDIIRMQASFMMYMNQYLADFPEEKQLLVDAFKVGIPEKIVQHAGEPEYGAYLRNLGPRFAEAARRSQDEAAWAVATWALALGRTEDYIVPERRSRVYPEDVAVQESPETKFVTQTMMASIVAIGGGLGGLIAALLFTLLLPELTDAMIYGTSAGKSSLAGVLLVLIMGFATAVVAAAAAVGGWLVGRGSELPWGGFSIAMGTAFTMYFIILALPIPFLPILVKPALYFGSIFATVYKYAARGGNY